MRIVKLVAENFKRLKAVAITPDGSIIRITGENASGKTSLLDAIYGALAGKNALPSKPVRRGEKSARIRLDLGEIIVTRRFLESGETTLTVESVEGAVFPSPQRMLDDLLGQIAFDPLAFSREKPKAQLETLRGLVKLDVDIDAIDAANLGDYTKRAEWNRKVKSLEERVSTLAAGVEPEMDVTPIDVSELTTRLSEAYSHNAAVDRERTARATKATDYKQRGAQFERDIGGMRQDIAELQRRLGLAEQALSNLKEQHQAHDALPPVADPIDATELADKINDAGKVNTLRERQIHQRAAHSAAQDDLITARNASKILTEQMEARAEQKAAAIGSATMPIDGLSFGEGMVLYNDIPFDQASMAEQIRVSMAIAMAANPKLRVVLIRDGSLLDAKSLAIVEEMAEAHDFQVFLESVSSGGKVGIELVDGSVASVDGVPVEIET